MGVAGVRVLIRSLILSAALCAAPVRAAEWFVATTGSDQTGTGTFAAPFRTITHALEPANGIVQPGDIVTLRGLVGNNTYNECDVRLRMPLTLRSFAGERAHIHCDISNVDTVTIQIDPDASGSTLSRLEVSGGFYYGIFLQTDWFSGGGEMFGGASNVLIDDLKIHHTGRDAIKITPKCNDVTIQNSEIWNSGAIYPPGTLLDDKNAEGIDNVNGSRMRVRDTHIHDIATTGLYFKGGAADVMVERNVIERTGVGGVMFGFDTSPEFFDTAINPGYYEAVRGIVRNNLVRDTGYAGIGLYATQDATVVNNTILHTAQLGHAAIYFGVTLQDFEPQAGRPANINPTIRNNLIIQNGGDCLRVRWANELGGLSGLSGNPGTDYNWFHNTAGECNFADNRPGSALDEGGSLSAWRAFENADTNSQSGEISVSADGHLPVDSPAIDQGQTVASVTDDIDGELRSALFDIGSDERAPGALFFSGFE
jgi:Right handed beta helix region